MLKIVRNTVFTLTVIILTGVALRWHSQALGSQSLLGIGRTVLASQSLGVVSPDFPLKINFNSSQVRLGQTETTTITTVPNAHLDIITQYPDGSINHPQTRTVQADATGNYSFTSTINNFRDLGVFRLSAVASSGSKTTEAVAEFKVTPWELPGVTSASPYSYPLAP